jgi:hypothetical protein
MSLEQKKAFLGTFDKPYTDKVIGLATVSTSEDGTKHYQQVHTDFLPGWMWPKLQQALKDGKQCGLHDMTPFLSDEVLASEMVEDIK